MPWASKPFSSVAGFLPALSRFRSRLRRRRAKNTTKITRTSAQTRPRSPYLRTGKKLTKRKRFLRPRVLKCLLYKQSRNVCWTTTTINYAERNRSSCIELEKLENTCQTVTVRKPQVALAERLSGEDRRLLRSSPRLGPVPLDEFEPFDDDAQLPVPLDGPNATAQVLEMSLA